MLGAVPERTVSHFTQLEWAPVLLAVEVESCEELPKLTFETRNVEERSNRVQVFEGFPFPKILFLCQKVAGGLPGIEKPRACVFKTDSLGREASKADVTEFVTGQLLNRLAGTRMLFLISFFFRISMLYATILCAQYVTFEVRLMCLGRCLWLGWDPPLSSRCLN